MFRPEPVLGIFDNVCVDILKLKIRQNLRKLLVPSILSREVQPVLEKGLQFPIS